MSANNSSSSAAAAMFDAVGESVDLLQMVQNRKLLLDAPAGRERRTQKSAPSSSSQCACSHRSLHQKPPPSAANSRTISASLFSNRHQTRTFQRAAFPVFGDEYSVSDADAVHAARPDLASSEVLSRLKGTNRILPSRRQRCPYCRECQATSEDLTCTCNQPCPPLTYSHIFTDTENDDDCPPPGVSSAASLSAVAALAKSGGGGPSADEYDSSSAYFDDNDVNRFQLSGLPLFVTSSVANRDDDDTDQTSGGVDGGLFDVAAADASMRSSVANRRPNQRQDSWTSSLIAEYCCCIPWSSDTRRCSYCCWCGDAAGRSETYRQRYRRRRRKLLPPEACIGSDVGGPTSLPHFDDSSTGGEQVGGSYCDVRKVETLSGGSGNRKVSALSVTERCRRAVCIACILLAGLFVAVVGIVIGLTIVGPIVLSGSSWRDERTSVMSEQESLTKRLHNVSLAPSNTEFNYHVSGSGGDSPNIAAEWLTGGWSSWVSYSGGSSNGSRYKAYNRASTYHAAQEHCRKLGGYLVRINTIREQVFIENFLRYLLFSNSTNAEGGLLQSGGVGFWLGARRARGSHGDTCMFGQWKWVDPYGRTHGIISGFTAFIPGKPDNYYSPEECLFISYRDADDEERFLKWDDAPCDLNSVGGIKALCEIETR